MKGSTQKLAKLGLGLNHKYDNYCWWLGKILTNIEMLTSWIFSQSVLWITTWIIHTVCILLARQLRRRFAVCLKIFAVPLSFFAVGLTILVGCLKIFAVSLKISTIWFTIFAGFLAIFAVCLTIFAICVSQCLKCASQYSQYVSQFQNWSAKGGQQTKLQRVRMLCCIDWLEYLKLQTYLQLHVKKYEW